MHQQQWDHWGEGDEIAQALKIPERCRFFHQFYVSRCIEHTHCFAIMMCKQGERQLLCCRLSPVVLPCSPLNNGRLTSQTVLDMVSDFVFADTSVRSPGELFVCVIKEILHRTSEFLCTIPIISGAYGSDRI